jgi:hypothetical protein
MTTKTKAPQITYYLEFTDTFGGDANYSWVSRFKTKASSALGAIRKLSKEVKLSFHCVEDYGYIKRYDSASGATCVFVEEMFHQEEAFKTIKEI